MILQAQIYTFPTKRPRKNYTFPINNNKKNYTFPKKQPEKLFFSIETENYQLSRQSCRRAERRGETKSAKGFISICPSLWAFLPIVLNNSAQRYGQSCPMRWAEYIVVRDEVLLLTREEILLLTRLKLLLLQIIQLNIRSTGTACLLGVFSYF